MITTNPYAVSEADLGLPSAADLAALANAYFPDLTTGISVPTGTTVSDAAVNPGVNGAAVPGAEEVAATAPDFGNRGLRTGDPGGAGRSVCSGGCLHPAGSRRGTAGVRTRIG